METSQELNHLYEALANIQGELPIIGKKNEARGRNISFKYAKITEIVTGARAICSKHGVCVSHIEEEDGDYKILISEIAHSSGQYKRVRNKIYADPSDAKNFGAAKTKLEKRVHCSLLGILTTDQEIEEEEDMQKEAMNEGRKVRVPVDEKVEYLVAHEIKHLEELSKEHPEIKQTILNAYRLTSFKEIPKQYYDRVCALFS